LILDDSTSAVDAETEYQIQLALAHLMRGRTSFVIAQRISTVRTADLILVLDRGQIVAQGRHDDLLRESALYGEIVDSQLGAAGPARTADGGRRTTGVPSQDGAAVDGRAGHPAAPAGADGNRGLRRGLRGGLRP
jgi:ABC-type multidrug transport system ATPase subunit